MNFRMEFDGQSIGVQDLRPWRKSKALTLYDKNTNNEVVLAYFRDNESVDLFNGFLAKLEDAQARLKKG